MTALARSLLACTLLAIATAARAQPFPTGPVRVVVPYTAGGATDVIARAVFEELGRAWGHSIVIENKPGAGTALGAETVAKAAPDGHTLLATAEATVVVNPFIYAKLSYDADKDFAPVSGLGIINQFLIVHPSVPVKSVAEFVALTRAKPGEITYATFGIGSPSHLNMVMLMTLAGVTLRPVHYRGGAPALTDVIGGHVNSLIISTTLSAQPWRAGQVKVLGVGSARRLADYADVPTIAEAGVPGYETNGWFGVWAPAGTSKATVTKLNADIQRVLVDPAFRQRFLVPNQFEPMLGSPDEFARFMRTDRDRWEKVIKQAGIKAE